MDEKSIERVVRGAVSSVLTRIISERQPTSGNEDNRHNSESEVEDNQLAIQNSTQGAKKKR